MENTPNKKGRGRPRKNPVTAVADDAPENIVNNVEAEEVILAPQRVDIDDLRASVPQAASAEPEPEVETIYMGPQPESAAPPPPPPPRASPDVLEMFRAASMQPTPTPTAPPVDDSKARKKELLGKIKKYRENFPAVAAMHFSESWGVEELDAHLESIRVAVSAKTTGVLVKSAYLMGVKGVEVTGCAVGLKVYGLSDLLSRSAEIESILRELQCELPVIGHIGPGHRLALATFGAALALDSANRKAEVLGQFKQAPVSETVSQKYGDL